MRGDGTVLTIGHSNHSQETFLGLLERHRVTALADVRSTPWSRFNPHFNRKSLAAVLAARGIEYLYFGRELGGRPDDPACYEEGRIRYDRIARTERFREGVDQVVGGATEYRVALMCAEKEPLECHRTLLVGQALHAQGTEVAHIHADGRLEPHSGAMDRLLARIGLDPGDDLFRRHEPRDALIAEAIVRMTGRPRRAVSGSAAAPSRRRPGPDSRAGENRRQSVAD